MRWGAAQDRGYSACLARAWCSVALSCSNNLIYDGKPTRDQVHVYSVHLVLL